MDYFTILQTVCKITSISEAVMASSCTTHDVAIARALYLKIISNCGLDIHKALLILNKSRNSADRYNAVFDTAFNESGKFREQYTQCYSIVTTEIEKKLSPEEKEQAEYNRLKKEALSLPRDKHYTLSEDIAILRAIEESKRFMQNYGKGLHPLLAGHAITRIK